MAFVSLAPTEVDAKSPIDDSLMDKIRLDLDDLDSRVIDAAAATLNFTVTGRLYWLSQFYTISGETFPRYRYYRRALSEIVLSEAMTPSVCRYSLKRSGNGGNLGFDIRKHTSLRIPITAITSQFTAATTSVAKAGSSLSTQSIARNASQISTQSISFAKASNNIQSIILLGTVTYASVENSGNGTDVANCVQINLASTVDSDTLVNDYVTIASASSGGNNGSFQVVERNRGGGNNIVISNSSGVAQTGVAGTLQIQIMAYNYTNPVSTTDFTAGYAHVFASHSTSANNGTFTVYAVNSGGNNVLVKNPSGVTQAGVAGTLDTSFWKFALGSAASATDYVVGETVVTASHTNSNNNNNSGQFSFEIIAVNSGGNNLVLYNSAGVAQGGAVGNINTNRWVYALGSDPSAQVTAGDMVNTQNYTDPLNEGTFVVKQVNRSAANNIVVHNRYGVAQASTPGNISTTKKLIKFSSDQSANFTANTSRIEMKGCVDNKYNAFTGGASGQNGTDGNWTYTPLLVTQVNRGGGANFNVVVDVAQDNTAALLFSYSHYNTARDDAADQASPAGYVFVEMKSIFSSPPISFASDYTGREGNDNIVGTTTALLATVIPAQTPLMLYITENPDGDPKDLVVSIR